LIAPGRCPEAGNKDGDVVRIYNSRGACLADAVCVHGNANVLTHDRGTSKLSQGPSSGTNMVEIGRWKEPLPPARAFEPPEVAWVS
jgi:biotin/methionine sulfoxide reductase